jgi:signal transduction histidine kinase
MQKKGSVHQITILAHFSCKVLNCRVSNSARSTIINRWQQLRPRLTVFYTIAALALLIIGTIWHMHQPGQPGGLFNQWQFYGPGLLASICWLFVGGMLFGTARDWSGAVEGLTLLPPAILLLLLHNQGYAVIGSAISLFIALYSLLFIPNVLPLKKGDHKQGRVQTVRMRRRTSDLLTQWLVIAGLGFCLSILPILLGGNIALTSWPLYLLVALYPLILWHIIRSQRLINGLHLMFEQKEEAQHNLEQTVAQLRQDNSELQHATSLLLQADAHLRALLSQRIHDQARQQALRIRSLLAHWQYKLHVEAERDAGGKVAVQPIIEVLSKMRKISEELEGDLRGLQLLTEDVYQRRSLGLRQHLEKLIREDLPTLYPASPLKVQADLWALDTLDPNLERTEQGAKLAEAISYTVTQALLNIYQHAGANFAIVRAVNSNGTLAISIHDDGHGFDVNAIPFEKTSLFKARLKARETGGWLMIESVPRSQIGHGTTVILHLPRPFLQEEQVITPDAPLETRTQDALESP